MDRSTHVQAAKPFSRTPALPIVSLAVSLLLHGLVVIAVEFLGDGRPDLELRYHAYALGGLSAAMNIVALRVRSRGVFLAVWGGRAATIAVLSVPFGPDLGIVLPLLASLLLEIAVFVPPTTAIPLGATAIAAIVFASVARASEILTTVGSAIHLAVLSGLVLGLATFVTSIRERMVRESQQVAKLDNTVREVSATNLRLQQLAFRAGEESRVAERNRITSEVHDAVGYTLTNLIMMMEAATDLVHDDPVRLSRLMRDARDQATRGLEETRMALRRLRKHDEPPVTGVQAYERLFQAFQRASSVAIQAEYGNMPMSLGEQVDSVVYHFVQEGLTNAIRHGMSTRILVIFRLDRRRLTVTMTDNGVGVEKIVPGLGITGMRERSARFDGSVAARRVPHGFEVRMALTVPEQAHG